MGFTLDTKFHIASSLLNYSGIHDLDQAIQYLFTQLKMKRDAYLLPATCKDVKVQF